jgi:hypothetical protein
LGIEDGEDGTIVLVDGATEKARTGSIQLKQLIARRYRKQEMVIISSIGG